MNDKIPNIIRQYLKKYGIDTEDVLYTAKSGIGEDYRFADGYVLLTADSLVVIKFMADENVQYRFGGYSGNDGDPRYGEPAMQVYQLEDIERLDIVREISGGALVSIGTSGDQYICKFSNTRMSEFERMKNNLEKVKKKEELTKKDLEGEKKIECCPKCGTIYPDQERKVCPKCMDKKSIGLRMAKYFTAYKLKIVIMVICFVVTAALNLVYPYLSGTILYDKVLSQNENFMKAIEVPGSRYAMLLGFTVLAMIVSKVLMQLTGIIQGVCTAKIVPDVVARIKQQVFDSMGRLSINFYNSRQTGGLMTRVLDDAGQVTGFFIDGVPYFVTNVITIILTCVVMFRLNWKLAIVSIMLLPVIGFMSYQMMPRLWSMYGKRHRASRRLNGQMNDNITGARVVKAFGQEESEMKRFKKSNGGVRVAELSIAKYDNKYYALYSIGENLASFMVWGLGSALILNGSGLEFGVLMTFAGYVTQLNGPLDFMSFMFRWTTNSMNSAQRIFEIIDAVPDVAEKEHPVILDEVKGEIELKHVTFSYEPHKPILKDISFHVEAGQMLGIVGKSGAGKSTLVNLISRLYDAQEGEILLDGVNVRDLSFHQLRKNIAMVSQETYIFMGTVAENIAYARPEASRKEIIEAAIQARCHDFICKMPEGYDTIVGSSGRMLSGGEKQRLSIARAILANPKILILDEATAAVDTETELAIQESLEKLIKGRTTLSIAHRLSTLRNADELIVIDDGKVTEQGTHKELIEKKGTYYKLMELQTKALAMRGMM